MKHLELFETYRLSASGSFNKVISLDDEWVLKTPLNKEETALEPAIIGDKLTQKAVLGEFRRHIKFMSKFPEFFPSVKLLSPNRAVVERVDSKKAKDEICYITKICLDLCKGQDFNYSPKEWSIIENFYRNTGAGASPNYSILFNRLMAYGKDNKDAIVEKWVDLIIRLKENSHQWN